MKTTVALLLFGAIVGSAVAFKCYSCSSTLTAQSTCMSSVANVSTIDCTTNCYAEVLKVGSVVTKIDRGCKASCVTDDSCNNVVGSGTCRTCCTTDRCNSNFPGGAEVTGVSVALLLVSSVFTVLGAL